MDWHALGSDQLLKRHQLVRLTPRCWDAWLGAQPVHEGTPLLREWGRRRWPLVVRRPIVGEAGIPLGIPLPPSTGKQRIALAVSLADIEAVSALPRLGQAIIAAPEAWEHSLLQLLALAARYGVRQHVFGSLAWQWMTGLPYLSPQSDLDMTWTLPARPRLHHFLDELASVDAHAPMRIDGELLRADGAGVNWREARACTDEVAIKTSHGLQMHRLEAFAA
ncbi:malonate decarboxylase holo-[acyl-carrier-protein] synthase [Dyella sp.]|uniref:malonate decarboxylase holo-[acyl-carrier-protein] synthase n=1 Tax=Dyella sp. TaxID=1869338 RepID=UPI002ED4BD5C